MFQNVQSLNLQKHIIYDYIKKKCYRIVIWGNLVLKQIKWPIHEIDALAS